MKKQTIEYQNNCKDIVKYLSLNILSQIKYLIRFIVHMKILKICVKLSLTRNNRIFLYLLIYYFLIEGIPCYIVHFWYFNLSGTMIPKRGLTHL